MTTPTNIEIVQDVHRAPALADIARQCGGELPLPLGAGGENGEAVFAEPWQAHAFAMTVLLHQRGLFSWPQWAAALSAEIRNDTSDDGRDDGSRYYSHWLNALEKLVIERQLGSAEQIHALEHAWEDAARRTPHGQPIVLDPIESTQNR